MSSPAPIPLIMTTAGAQPSLPSSLQSALISAVAAVVPGYTANLPGTLIDDVASTDVGALVTVDQARVDSINNAVPYSANAYMLSLLGAQFGVPQGQQTNTSVQETFTCTSTPTAGQIIPTGTTVSDGTYQYVVLAPGGVTSSAGTVSLTCVSPTPGSWTPAANTVTQLLTSFPSGVTITATNPQAGTPGSSAQTPESYRSQLLGLYQSPAQGVASYITGQLQAIPGVNPRLVLVLQATGGWEIICGGGDSYTVAYAILNGLVDLSTLVGSSVSSSRNVVVSITDGVNTFSVTYVNPPDQVVTGTVSWNTNLPNFTQGALVSQAAAAALTTYINSIQVGQSINLNVMTTTFATAISGYLPASAISALSYTIAINGTTTAPSAGTQLIPSDPESYFTAAAGAIVVSQA